MLIGKERMQQEIWFQKYRIISLLGRGGTAKVFLAEHIYLNSHRAIKCISKNNPLYNLQRNEALILKNLKHSCIPIIYDIEEDEDGSYIIEQYIEGVTLKEYVTLNGPLEENIIIRFALQICDLIHYMHSNERPILYLDIKPDNIIVSGSTLKLIDFGSAIYRDELSTIPNISGTRGYAAPELYHNNGIDERSDVYGIGMLLYYLVTGLRLNQTSSEITNIDQIGNCSKKLKKIINQCLKFNPSQRFASVTHLSKQLSAMICTNGNHNDSSQSIRIAVAGAQPRIGVTHLAFRLCTFFIHRKLPCLYEEKNNNQSIRTIRNCYDELVEKDGICEIKGIPMIAYGQEQPLMNSKYQIRVQDYGCLNSDNWTDFLDADLKLLLLGGKDWELEHAEQALKLVAEYKDVVYLFNFLNGRQFHQVMKSMDQRYSFRIPYEPDPFAPPMEGNGLELFEELTRTIMAEQRNYHCRFRRRSRWYETKADTI
jgi:eukaryotic-like serine/threonine-protein kinase